MEKIKPLGERLLVLRDGTENTTPMGIVIPDQYKENKTTGTIIEISEDLCDCRLKVGDRVLLPKGGGVPVHFGGIEYEVFPLENVYGVILTE